MSESVFEKWNKKVNADELKKSQEEIANNGSMSFDPVPHGTYEVFVDKLELKKSKKGENMVTIWFKILAGDNKNAYIFYNKIFEQYDFMRHDVCELLADLLDNPDMSATINAVLKGGNKTEIENLLLDIHEEIGDKFEYALVYEKDKKDYDTYAVKEVFEVA